jgi:hypothetical protein
MKKNTLFNRTLLRQNTFRHCSSLKAFVLTNIAFTTLGPSFSPAIAQTDHSSTEERMVIEEYKQSERGPFGNVRWFCNNGQIIVPRSGDCSSRGDGVQHGELLSTTKEMRARGYLIANVFAALNPDNIKELSYNPGELNWIILERYLVARDDGWIFRRARYVRGMLQAEDEAKGARNLLTEMLERPKFITEHYLLNREAVRLYPGLFEEASLHYVRAESSRLASLDPRFRVIKNKLHNQPDPKDSAKIERYAESASRGLRSRYLLLANRLDSAFDSTRNADLVLRLLYNVQQSAPPKELLDTLEEIKDSLESTQLSIAQSEKLFDALYQLRKQLTKISTAQGRLAALTLSVKLEDYLVSQLLSRTNPAELLPRQDLLQHLYHLGKALYGIGLVSEREQHALSYSVAHLLEDKVSITEYEAELQYLQRVMSWSAASLEFQFGPTIQKFAIIEPVITEFIDDRLRASLLSRYSRLLNILLKDSLLLTKKEHSLFKSKVFNGIRSMNPGLARGMLIDPSSSYIPAHDPGTSIYMVPETVAQLPAVAGIITQQEGNPLSHVQLLARNLGIPNVVVDESLLSELRKHIGKNIVLAASRNGRVMIDKDGSQWHQHFSENKTKSKATLLEPDVDKLELDETKAIPLEDLRSDDSGERVGPKAAKLGELKVMFPTMVTNGLTLPFGAFNEVLKTPFNSTQTLHEWMLESYARIKRARAGRERIELTKTITSSIREFIINWQFPTKMRNHLESALRKAFGYAGNYGVFVRSDTNIEDLPNFTGAGLNLTLPNVIGTENILNAIKEVWASPFTERAFSWRQSSMSKPEHVYVSVLLLKSVAVDRSGVMLTGNIETGDLNDLTVAMNEGIGGAVDNQKAESILLNRQTGIVRLLSKATAQSKKVLLPNGGIGEAPTSFKDELIKKQDLLQLNKLSLRIHDDFPGFRRSNGTGIADVEFGFLNNKLALFQIRPFVEGGWVKEIGYLKTLDKGNKENLKSVVDLKQVVYAQL